jgi:polyisoprenoid-binding protein YceI
LETSTYPSATFVLTEPIELGSEPAEGAIYSVVATGELTLHGVTQPVEITLEAQLTSGALVIVGSLEIELADYDITPPATQIALSVNDHGTLELQLILSQSAG